MSGILFIISSPSGGGKGTLIREVLHNVPNIGYSISFTTRSMRAGEIHGQHYFFVSPEEFENLIEDGEFLEYAVVHGNFYGTSKTQVANETSQGRDIILELDVQGARSVRQIMPEAVSIFILPPSYQVLRDRLVLRQTESENDLILRLQNARDEVRDYKNFDYVIINDEMTKATLDLQSVILAERLKRARQETVVENILKTFKIENFLS
ncbi:MAG: guanylate kinase [Pyrinomonadaceae bacterium]